jgi:hypothetical protein
MVKAEFWTDPELLRWPLAKRDFYRGLWSLAEDSGCLEDDTFAWKLQLFPSPLDADVSIEKLGAWRDELVTAGKAVPYESAGKRYLFMANFHKHESPRNPQRADLPLPKWVSMESKEGVSHDGKRWVRCLYKVDTAALPTPNGVCTDYVRDPQSRPVPSRLVGVEHMPAQETELASPDDQEATNDPTYSDDFEAFWSVYPRHIEKRKAWRQWQARLKTHVSPKGMAKAAANYAAASVGADPAKIKYPATFIGRDMPFTDWVSGVPPSCVPQNGKGMTAAEIWAKAEEVDRAEESGDAAGGSPQGSLPAPGTTA